MTSLSDARRIVIKIGSSLIADGETGKVRIEWMRALAQDIFELQSAGKMCVIVSSGAVALGRPILGLGSGKLKLELKQAAAAAGQVPLVLAWADVFRPHNIPIAQALVTPDDTERRRRWLNARATLETLLGFGAIPVVNENDTVATEELRYGDNDRLAARVAQLVGADALILLSDIDGLYDADPRVTSSARHIERVDQITPELEAMAGGINAAAGVGSGGMRTKIEAAKIATAAGCGVMICNGQELHPIRAALAGGKMTWFAPQSDPATARQLWLAHSLNPAGSYFLDKGAVKALRDGGSLLPIGVTALEGHFERGDAVSLKDPSGKGFAIGVSAYASGDASRILGQHSDAIEEILGYAGRPALVHRDDLVLNS